MYAAFVEPCVKATWHESNGDLCLCLLLNVQGTDAISGDEMRIMNVPEHAFLCLTRVYMGVHGGVCCTTLRMSGSCTCTSIRNCASVAGKRVLSEGQMKNAHSMQQMIYYVTIDW